MECDAVPEIAGTDAIVATDNCSGDLSYAEGTELRIDGDCPSNYVLIRKWDVTDACGLTSTWTQNIIVQDTSSPTLTSEAAGETVECDGEGNLQQLSDWIDSNGGATASDNCGQVTWSNDYTGLSSGGSESAEYAVSVDQENAEAYYPIAGDMLEDLIDCDDCTEYVELGFEFEFFGNTFDGMYVGTNGAISFTDDDDYCCSGDPIAENYYENAIMIMHTDLDPDESENDQIRVQTLGSAPNREFVLSYQVVPNYEENEVLHTGQLVLFEGSNVIKIFYDGHVEEIYDEMTIGISHEDMGAAAEGFVEFENPVSATRFTFTPMTETPCGATGSVAVTFTATDDCGNASSTTATFTIEDTIAPAITVESRAS